MAGSSLDMDLSRLSLGGGGGGGSPFAQSQQQQFESQVPPHSYAQPNQQQPQMVGGLQPHQIMQPPVHSGPPPHVQLQEPQRRRGVVKFFSTLHHPLFYYPLSELTESIECA